MKNDFTKILLENFGGYDVQKITESTLNRINYHVKNSTFIIISAFISKDFASVEENLGRTNKLKKIIQKKKLSYVPVYGGYKMESGEVSYETSFMIFNVKANSDKELIPPEELYEFGFDLIQNAPGQTVTAGFKKGFDKINVENFGQESFLYKEVNKPAVLVYQDGHEVEIGNTPTFNDATEMFFTALNRRNHERKTDKFFSIKESYINGPARTIHGGMVRAYSGEMFETTF